MQLRAPAKREETGALERESGADLVEEYGDNDVDEHHAREEDVGQEEEADVRVGAAFRLKDRPDLDRGAEDETCQRLKLEPLAREG